MLYLQITAERKDLKKSDIIIIRLYMSLSDEQRRTVRLARRDDDESR